MQLESLRVFRFPVPFRVVVRHASATRAQAENVIVAARTTCGQVGYGEGCPRRYVTGETVATARAFIEGQERSIIEAIGDTDGLRTWIEAHGPEIDGNPAAFCAVELALLDVLGKLAAAPVEDVIGLPRLHGSHRYSAVLGDSSPIVYWWRFRRYWRDGFRDFKVKVSGIPDRDRRKIDVFRRRSDPSLRVRLDANNLWHDAADCIRHLAALGYDFFAVEEPLQIGDLAGFRRVGEALQTKIVLDESLLRPEQLDALDEPDRWIINLRVSKMGGILRSLEVARRAERRGIGVIVGAQVGETSLLTRAALAVANVTRGNLLASEGAFGTHLLRRDLASPSLKFGRGGELAVEKALDPGAPGLGLDIDEAALALADTAGG